jgi:hypothetical protein
MLDRIPKDGSKFDLQSWIFKLVSHIPGHDLVRF